MLVLLAFVIADMRQAALAYLGLNPAKPAVEFEIRLPKGTLTTAADTQIELVTDRNQKLAKLQEALTATDDGRSILRGTVTLDYRTAERVMLLNLPGQAQGTFRLRRPPLRALAPRRRHRARQRRHGDDGDSRHFCDPLPRALRREGQGRTPPGVRRGYSA